MADACVCEATSYGRRGVNDGDCAVGEVWPTTPEAPSDVVFEGDPLGCLTLYMEVWPAGLASSGTTIAGVRGRCRVDEWDHSVVEECEC
eukprot:scaffold168768_cov37-Tisochrysis_lutea.AAC.5